MLNAERDAVLQCLDQWAALPAGRVDELWEELACERLAQFNASRVHPLDMYNEALTSGPVYLRAMFELGRVAERATAVTKLFTVMQSGGSLPALALFLHYAASSEDLEDLWLFGCGLPPEYLSRHPWLPRGRVEPPAPKKWHEADVRWRLHKAGGLRSFAAQARDEELHLCFGLLADVASRCGWLGWYKPLLCSSTVAQHSAAADLCYGALLKVALGEGCCSDLLEYRSLELDQGEFGPRDTTLSGSIGALTTGLLDNQSLSYEQVASVYSLADDYWHDRPWPFGHLEAGKAMKRIMWSSIRSPAAGLTALECRRVIVTAARAKILCRLPHELRGVIFDFVWHRGLRPLVWHVAELVDNERVVSEEETFGYGVGGGDQSNGGGSDDA